MHLPAATVASVADWCRPTTPSPTFHTSRLRPWNISSRCSALPATPSFSSFWAWSSSTTSTNGTPVSSFGSSSSASSSDFWVLPLTAIRPAALDYLLIHLYNRRFPPDGHRQSIPTQARQSTGAIYYGLRGTPRGRQFLLGRNAPAFSHQAQADVCYDDSGRYPLHRLCASKIPFFLPSFQSIGSRRTNRLSPPLIRAALSSSLSGSCTFKRTARPSSTSWMKWTRRLVLRRTIAPSIYIYALRQFSRPTLSTF